MGKTPIKGEPDFSPYTDEQVSEMKEVTERMIGAFFYDPEFSGVLKKVYEALANEHINRLADKPFKSGVSILKKKSLKFNQNLRR